MIRIRSCDNLKNTFKSFDYQMVTTKSLHHPIITCLSHADPMIETKSPDHLMIFFVLLIIK